MPLPKVGDLTDYSAYLPVGVQLPTYWRMSSGEQRPLSECSVRVLARAHDEMWKQEKDRMKIWLERNRELGDIKAARETQCFNRALIATACLYMMAIELEFARRRAANSM